MNGILSFYYYIIIIIYIIILYYIIIIIGIISVKLISTCINSLYCQRSVHINSNIILWWLCFDVGIHIKTNGFRSSVLKVLCHLW